MKIDWGHVLALFGAPMLTGFFDYLVNSQAPFSRATLEHAALATSMVGLALAKQSFLPDNRANPPVAK
jgi:hypothetical protein